MFKINNRNTAARCEMCSKLTIKTPEQRQWRRCCVFSVNFEYILHLVLVILMLTFSRYMQPGTLPSTSFKERGPSFHKSCDVKVFFNEVFSRSVLFLMNHMQSLIYHLFFFLCKTVKRRTKKLMLNS